MKSLIEQMQILLPWNDDVKFENFITEYFNDLEDRYSIAEDCSVVTQNFQFVPLFPFWKELEGVLFIQ
jgi:hypothetical protein